MSEPYPKRLIEVDLPIKKISEHARREKSIRHGHISTLHIWWARRPLAACRAVICAALWPDPADELCPQDFRDKAASLINDFAKIVSTSSKLTKGMADDNYGRWMAINKTNINPKNKKHFNTLRHALLDFIADFANWDNSTVKEYLETARALTQIAHESLGGEKGTRPLVVDPFAGGGSIPLEALRVGADAFASDLNPVAVLLNKVVLEYIPKYGKKLAEEVRKWGDWIKKEAEKELAEFYPKDPDGSTPIAYLWARTIKCEGPGCGAEVPLMRSLWLAKKGTRKIAIKLIPDQKNKIVDFEIIKDIKEKDVGDGTVKRGAATCPVCGYTTPVASVRAQLKSRNGGANDARMFCVVTTKPDMKGRFYRLPTQRDLEAIGKANIELEKRKKEYKGVLSLIPDEPYPDETAVGALSSSVTYGNNTWGDIFNNRQLLSLTTLVKLINQVIISNKDNSLNILDPLNTCLGIALDKQCDINSSLCRWRSTNESFAATFGRQALPMVWDFAENNFLSYMNSSFNGSFGWIIKIIEKEKINHICSLNILHQSALKNPLPNDSADYFITDPPYYDAIAYGDLSDFFYVWLKRVLKDIHKELFFGNLVDKSEEIVHLSKRYKGAYAHKTKEFFEEKMKIALLEGSRITSPNGAGVIIFAHKSTSGWEAQLTAMIEANWIITGSWPIDTESPGRMNAMGTASLASSIHLVCRPRIKDEIGDWRDVLSELPVRIHEWMPRLAAEGVVGADAIFSCLGPALEIFSRYSKVEKVSGEEVPLREYLEEVWAAVSKEALEMIFEDADTSGFEEDARITAMWLWTLSTGKNGKDKEADETVKIGGYYLEYDAARKIAQGLGAHLEKLQHLVEIKGDKARLLPVDERTKYLFGKDQEVSDKKKKKKNKQQMLFETLEEVDDEFILNLKDKAMAGKTVLDKVHQSMIMFGAGRGEALKRFLVEEGIGRDERYWKLAQALSALYPPESEEKRWVDGVLARKKGLGF